MKHPNYTSETIGNSPDHKRVRIQFNSSNIAETARAMLLAEGYTPAELGLNGHSEQQVMEQAQNRTLELTGKNATDFNFFFKHALQFARDFQDYTLKRDVEVGLPTVHYDAHRKSDKSGEKIFPVLRVYRFPVKDIKAGQKMVDEIREKGIPIELVDRGRKIDIEPDRIKQIDFVMQLRELLGSGRPGKGGWSHHKH